MVTVRGATVDDWPAMVEVFQAAGQAAWGHIMSAEALTGLTPPTRWLDLISADKEIFAVLVASSDDGVQGFVIAGPSGDEDAKPLTGEIVSMYTHPNVWGQGVGRTLMQVGTAFLVRGRFVEATLWTEIRNERPRRFYEALGWTLDGAERHREVRGSAIHELRYRLALTSSL